MAKGGPNLLLNISIAKEGRRGRAGTFLDTGKAPLLLGSWRAPNLRSSSPWPLSWAAGHGNTIRGRKLLHGKSLVLTEQLLGSSGLTSRTILLCWALMSQQTFSFALLYLGEGFSKSITIAPRYITPCYCLLMCRWSYTLYLEWKGKAFLSDLCSAYSCKACFEAEKWLLRLDQLHLEKQEGQRSPTVQKADAEAWAGVTGSVVQRRNKRLDRLRR